MHRYTEEGLTLIKSLSTLNKLLKIILPLIHVDFDIENFKVYLLGLILQERWFSTFGITKRNESKTMWQIYYALEKVIKWNNIYYTLANYCFGVFMGFNWYLVVDGSPLKQEYAKNRITKIGFICIKGMKNVPHNELISLSLTNGIIYIPLSFRIWTSTKVTKPNEYKTKTELFFTLMYEYFIRRIPVKTILFDNGFASMKMLQWFNDNGFTWYTRLKNNKKIKINGISCKLIDLDLNIEQGIILEMTGVKGLVKIIRICHQNEDVYIATNNTNIDDSTLIYTYKQRWKVEEFHREAKQHLGLENIRIRSWNKLQNHVGFVCLAYALLSVLRYELNGSIGNVKQFIHDEIYQTHNAHERLLHKLAC
jgi:hypothetical protein